MRGGKMPTKKEPEISIHTTISKFGGFIKVIALLTVGAGGVAGYNQLNTPTTPTTACAMEIDRKMVEYNARLVKVETRMDNTDLNILEIKASLIRIETYLMGK